MTSPLFDENEDILLKSTSENMSDSGNFDAVLELTICEEYALILAHDGDRHASHLTKLTQVVTRVTKVTVFV